MDNLTYYGDGFHDSIFNDEKFKEFYQQNFSNKNVEPNKLESLISSNHFKIIRQYITNNSVGLDGSSYNLKEDLEIKRDSKLRNLKLIRVKDPLKAPFRYVCKVFSETNKIDKLTNKKHIIGGTSFFVSKRMLLTAAHNLENLEKGNVERIVVIPGQNGSLAKFGQALSRKYFVHKKWKKNNRQFDYGVIVLPNNDLFNQVKGLFPISNSGRLDQTTWGAGYKSETTKNKFGYQYYTKGKITQIEKNEYAFSNKLVVGFSGSPIIIKSKNQNADFFMSIAMGTWFAGNKRVGIRFNNGLINSLKEWDSKLR